MTTKEDARVAIVTKIKAIAATWATYPLVVEYDNTDSVNIGLQTNPYLSVEILHIDAMQADMSSDPIHRVMGSIILTAKAKKGSGMKPANTLLEFFFPSMHMTDVMLPVRTYAARLTKAKPADGWIGECAVIPFWYDN